MNHAFIGVFEQLGVFARHRHCGAIVIHGFHPGEELGVERDGIGMCGQLGADLRIDLVQPVGRVRSGQGEEDGGDAAQHPARLFERNDRVGECRRFGVVDDGIDFSLVDRHALLERGDVIVFGNLAEIGRVERQGAVGREISGSLRYVCARGVGVCHGFDFSARSGGASAKKCGCCNGGQDLGLHVVPLMIVRHAEPGRGNAIMICAIGLPVARTQACTRRRSAHLIR